MVDYIERNCFSASMRNHRKRVHATQPKLYECDMCDKTFRDRKSMEDHKRQKHTRENLHYCHICGLGYVKQFYLKRHVEVHNPKRERNHQCQLCEKTYFTEVPFFTCN